MTPITSLYRFGVTDFIQTRKDNKTISGIDRIKKILISNLLSQ